MEDIVKLKVVELREALASRGLETKGVRTVLITRLKEHLATTSSYDPLNPTVDTEPETQFGDKRFIVAPTKGISFSLSTPKPAKVTPASVNQNQNDDLQNNARRSGAASFFLSELERLNSEENKEAKVPLPPSFGYKVDSGESSDEDGPPGAMPLKVPAIKFDKPFTKDLPKDKDVESWKKVTMPDLWQQRKNEMLWEPGVAMQDPALFLQEEAVMKNGELVTEIEHTEVPGLSLESVKMKVSYNYLVARAQGKTNKDAMNACAVKILKDSGPWLDITLLDSLTESLARLLPGSCKEWLPPKYNLAHARIEDRASLKQQKFMYSLSAKLGPLTCEAVGESMEDALQFLTLHLKAFIKNRDIRNLNVPDIQKEMRYTQGAGILRVTMEEDKKPQLPSLDLYTLQSYLIDGCLPALYCNKDIYGCEKIFSCDVCCHRVSGVENLNTHVQSNKHKNRLGKFLYQGKILETFKSSSDPNYGKIAPPKGMKWSEDDREKYSQPMCNSCEEEGKLNPATGKCQECKDYMCAQCREAHGQTRLTKSHKIVDIQPPALHHPRKDEEEGKKIKKNDEKYLLSVYRCPTQLPEDVEQQEEEYTGDTYEGEEYQDVNLAEQGENIDSGSWYNYENENYDQNYEGFRRKNRSSVFVFIFI